MILIDDHCHLMHSLYREQLDSVIERAKKAGVKAIICSGVNVKTNREALEIAKKYSPLVKCSLGIYPVDALGVQQDETGLSRQEGPINLEKEFEFIKNQKNNIAAVGECGLDYHWVKEQELQKKQRENFSRIIEFVEKLKKPIIVHTRRAEQDCIEMLMSSTLKKVVLHCFEAKKSLIKKAEEKGYVFSIPTSITRSQQFQTMAKIVSINQITTETDGPYLSPAPGTTNEPANVEAAVRKIAEIKGFTPEETANNIWVNFQRVYE